MVKYVKRLGKGFPVIDEKGNMKMSKICGVQCEKKVPIKRVQKLRKTLTFCKSMGMKQLIEVPIRKKGMTGSGKIKECHDNVELLVKTYGGKVVLGYTIELDIFKKKGWVRFSHHSVWETPEGKLVDVTYNQCDEDTVQFSPLVKYDPNTEWYETPPNVVFHPTKGVILLGEDEWGRVISNKSLKRNKSQIRDLLMTCIKEPSKQNDGGFSNPSTSTGEYFELRSA